MEVEITLTTVNPISEDIQVQPVTKNAYLIIKGNVELSDSVFLVFKKTSGREMKNPLNRNGLNKRISIPNWAGIVHLESESIEDDISFSVSVMY